MALRKLYDLVRVNTATTGTGTITLGAAVSGFLTFAGGGVSNGDSVVYAISDGVNSEAGVGTYTTAGTTLTRGPTASTNSNAAINLSGTAQVFITALATDFPIIDRASGNTILYGGTAAGSTLDLRSTSNASPSGDTVTVSSGGSVRATFLSGGNMGFGTETNPQFPFVFSTNATPGAIVGTLAAFGGPWTIGATSGIVGWNVLTVATLGNNNFFRIDGTISSPSNLLISEDCGGLNFGGWGAGATQAGRAQIRSITLEGWTATFGLGLQFNTTGAGAARAQAMYLKAGLIVGSSSTDPGAGKVTADTAYLVNSTQVVAARVTGYTAMTGSPDKATAYATGSVTLAQLAGRVAQLQADLTTHGLIGA